MNLFKKALLASAVAASFGAAADATVSSSPIKLSAEGVSIGNKASDVAMVFDVVVGTLHPAASTITLTFDSTVDLNGLTGGAVVNDPAEGTGVVDDGTLTAADSTVGFDYGTGSFTFDNVVIDDNDQTKGEQDTISFDINLGNPLTANSAFRIYLGDASALAGTLAAADIVDLSGAATVAYSSETSGGDAIETGVGTIAVEESQFAFAVKTPFDGISERVSQVTFAKNGTTATTDTFVFTATNNESLEAPVLAVDLTVDLEGQFDDGSSSLVDGDFAGTNQRTAGALATSVNLDEVNDDNLLITVDNLEIGTGAANDEVTVVYTYGAGKIPSTGTLDATAVFVDAAATPNKWTYTGDAGEWKLDATVVNIPYFPVGYEGTSSSVHFANETSAKADVIVSAIDSDGNTYGPLDLGSDLAGDTVTKVSQATIMSLFDLTDATKLSVTFNIDADKGDVNAHAFTSSSVGRTEIATSQQNNDF